MLRDDAIFMQLSFPAGSGFNEMFVSSLSFDSLIFLTSLSFFTVTAELNMRSSESDVYYFHFLLSLFG